MFYNRVLVLLIAAATATQFGLAATFQPLGFLPGATSFRSAANAISADGSTVVGSSVNSVGQTEAFRWTLDGGMIGLGKLVGGQVETAPVTLDSEAYAVSGDGSIVVGVSALPDVGSSFQAFRWEETAGMVGLGFLGGFPISEAFGISADGSVAVGYVGNESFPSNFTVPFRWTQQTSLVSLGLLSTQTGNHEAYDVSADGNTIVGNGLVSSATPGFLNSRAFNWSPQTGMVDLGVLPGNDDSTASAVSADGTTVVGQSRIVLFNPPSPFGRAKGEATLWRGGQIIGLGNLTDSFDGVAKDVSGDGCVVIGVSQIWADPNDFFGSARVDRSFIWDELNGIRDLQDTLETDFGLDLTGWTLDLATGISVDGLTIVGSGVNPAGNREAWIVSLSIPEPDSVALVLLANLGGTVLVKRSRNIQV